MMIFEWVFFSHFPSNQNKAMVRWVWYNSYSYLSTN